MMMRMTMAMVEMTMTMTSMTIFLRWQRGVSPLNQGAAPCTTTKIRTMAMTMAIVMTKMTRPCCSSIVLLYCCTAVLLYHYIIIFLNEHA